MRIRLLLSLVVVGFTAMAQMKVDKILYKGDSCYVYPVMLDGWTSEKDRNIPQLYDSLPSGKYILESLNYNGIKLVIGHFVVSNGKPNGFARFGNVNVEYKNGVKEGQYFYTNYGRIEETGTYVNGLLHGITKVYKLKGAYGETQRSYLYEEIEYQEGRKKGHYRQFYKNGQEKVYCSNFNGGNYSLSNLARHLMSARIKLGYFHERTNLYLDSLPHFTSKKVRKEYSKYYHTRPSYLMGDIYLGNMNGDVRIHYPNGELALKAHISNDFTDDIDFLSYNFVYPNGQQVYSIDSSKVDTITYTKVVKYRKDGSEMNRSTWTRLPGESSYKYFTDTYQSPQSSLAKFNYTRRLNANNDLIEKEYPEIIPEVRVFGDDRVDTVMYKFTQMGQRFSNNLYNSAGKKVKLKILNYSDSTAKVQKTIIDTASGVEFMFQYRLERAQVDKDIPIKFSNDFFSRRSRRINIGVSFCWGGRRRSYLPEDSILIKVNGKLFTGDYLVKENDDKHIAGFVEVKKNKIIMYDRYDRVGYGKASFVDGVIHGYFTKGDDSLFYDHGNLKRSREYEVVKRKFRKNKKYLLEEKNFLNNKLQGNQYGYEFDSDDVYKGAKSKEKTYYGLELLEIYNQDTLEGTHKEWYSDDFLSFYEDSLYKTRKKHITLPFRVTDTAGVVGLTDVVQYKNNLQDGVEMYFDEGSLEDITWYKNDEKHGLDLSLSYGDTLEFQNYINGIKDGPYYEKYDDGGLKEEGEYDMAIPVGTWKYYSKYGKPNAILNIDSAYMKSRYSGKPFRYISMTLSNIYEAGVGGDLTLYYSNENILAKGELTKGLRSGLWSFYNEHGEKLETNFYERDSVEVDSLKHYTNGNYVLFNVQGDTIAKGRLLRGVDLYDCSSDLRVRDYDRTFKTFISNSGDSLVKNGEGYVKLYDEFNVLRMEGGISKELKHAEWKYYDPTGNINEVGVYVYGFKDGVWLKGDLRAVQYKDPDCFVQNSEYSKDKELQRVSIERIYYKMGIQEKSQKVNTYRRK